MLFLAFCILAFMNNFSLFGSIKPGPSVAKVSETQEASLVRRKVPCCNLKILLVSALAFAGGFLTAKTATDHDLYQKSKYYCYENDYYACPKYVCKEEPPKYMRQCNRLPL